MRFHKTPLEDAYRIELDKRGDDRGFFAGVFCEKEFGAAGLGSRFVQTNNSLTQKRAPCGVCTTSCPPRRKSRWFRRSGALWDVIVDLCAGSPTYLKWFGVELTEDNRSMLYIPRRFGHGFITLTDNVEAFYLHSAFIPRRPSAGCAGTIPRSELTGRPSHRKCRTKIASGRISTRNFHGVKLMRRLR